MPKKPKNILEQSYNPESKLYEIGIDEVGRGPMFGRVYTAAVILPKNTDFKYELLKDSKLFSSKKKINKVAEYIKEHALAWTVAYEDETVIDDINIRNATHSAMHKSIREIINNYKQTDQIGNEFYLLVDGNDFKAYTYYDKKTSTIQQVNHITIKQGDNIYCSIAAASILAKVERDKYILELCECYKKLDIYYNLTKNKGYGAELHISGINTIGISPWHRKTFGDCKKAVSEGREHNSDFFL
jgi:ribonuclease HII